MLKKQYLTGSTKIRTLKAIFMTVILSLAAVGGAEISGKDSELFILCRRYSEIRFLRVEKNSDDSKVKCTSYYSKEGHEKMIGKSTSIDTCKSYTDKIIDVLKGVAWNCSTITAAKVFNISSTAVVKGEMPLGHSTPVEGQTSELNNHETKQN